VLRVWAARRWQGRISSKNARRTILRDRLYISDQLPKCETGSFKHRGVFVNLGRVFAEEDVVSRYIRSFESAAMRLRSGDLHERDCPTQPRLSGAWFIYEWYETDLRTSRPSATCRLFCSGGRFRVLAQRCRNRHRTSESASRVPR